jgi:hypothetical protein
MACCSYASYTLDGCNLILTNSNGHTVDIDLTQAEVRKSTGGKWVVQSLRSGSAAIHDDDALSSTGDEGDLTYDLVRQYISSCKAGGASTAPDGASGAAPAALPSQLTFAFALGATQSDTQDFGPYRAGSFYAPSEFNGDLISVYFDGPYGNPKLLFTFSTTDNHYEPTDTEMLSLFSKSSLYLTTNSATAAAADIIMHVKS